MPDVNATTLTEDCRKEMFARLVALQDGGMGVAQSREMVAAQFGVDVTIVAEVEQEGMDAGWPPL